MHLPEDPWTGCKSIKRTASCISFYQFTIRIRRFWETDEPHSIPERVVYAMRNHSKIVSRHDLIDHITGQSEFAVILSRSNGIYPCYVHLFIVFSKLRMIPQGDRNNFSFLLVYDKSCISCRDLLTDETIHPVLTLQYLREIGIIVFLFLCYDEFKDRSLRDFISLLPSVVYCAPPLWFILIVKKVRHA